MTSKNSSRVIASWSFASLLLMATCGCRMGATMVVWSAPHAPAQGASLLAVAPLAGEAGIADTLQQTMLATVPGNPFQVVGPDQLTWHPEIRQVSVASVTSDVDALYAARQRQIPRLLCGQILAAPAPMAETGAAVSDQDDLRLVVAWKLLDVQTGATLGSLPVSMDTKTALRLYPELSLQVGDPQHVLMQAAAREGWKLVFPWLTVARVQLALPWGSAGAKGIRQGIVYAHAGRWSDAEDRWLKVVEQHPKAHAALHNLALAAVARQDFDHARRLIQRACTLHPSDHYESTYAWIEQRRWEYHRAFQLPDPAEGWPLRNPHEASSANVP